MVRLLCFAGSTREGSFNKKLARLAHHIAEANGIEAVFVDLKDYPMPIYNGDLEADEGPPERARAFKALLGEYQGVFIASPEYNSSVTPLLKNTLDWVTRVRAKGESGLEVFKTRVFAICGASPGYYGGDAQPVAPPPDPRSRHRRDRDPAADRAAARQATPSRTTAASRTRRSRSCCTERGRSARRRRAKVRGRMMLPRDRLIVALDVPSVEEAQGADRHARRQRRRLQDRARAAVLRRLRARARAGASAAGRVFVDAKLLDIEATVERATAAIAESGATFLTVHALDRKTIEAAVRGRGDSAAEAARRDGADQSRARRSRRAGHRRAPLAELVLHRAMLAQEAGFDGVIASGQEARAHPRATGPDS